MPAFLIAFWLVSQAVPAVQEKPSAPQAAQPATPAQQRVQSKTSIPPTITFKDGTLTIQAADNGLNEVLRAVGRQTNIAIEGRLDGDERVAVKIGPSPLRDVLMTLLEGSHYSFVLISKESAPQAVEKIVLMSRLAPPTPEPGKPQPPTIDQVPIGTVISPDETDPDAPAPPPREPGVTGPDGKPIVVPKIVNPKPLQPPPADIQPAKPDPGTSGPPK